MDMMQALLKKDPDAEKIRGSRPVVINLRTGPELSEVKYTDRFGNEFTTFVEHN